MPLTRSELESKLSRAADILRGEIDSADYKSYIFSMLFLKRLSDRFEEEVDQAVAAGLDRATAETDPDEHELFVPADCRWAALTAHSMDLGEALNRASLEIEARNRSLDGILRTTNWNDDRKLGSPPNRDRIIRRLLLHFGDLNLRNDHLERAEVLSEASERLIEQLAADAGKKGGEFYTPRQVVKLLVALLDPKEGMRVCDPTAGSGGTLIYTAEYVRQHGGNPANLTLEGQEKKLGTLGLGKLNLLLHGLTSARLEGGDTITEPALVDERGQLLSYDRVIATPPLGLKEWGYASATTDPHHRFDRFGIPPKTKGDLAFLEHMLATTNASGMVGVVIPRGVLVRGGAEAPIRTNLLNADLFEAIIGLAPNLFYGASIPLAICILNKAKPPERRGKVLFVDAAQEGYYRPGKAQNHLDDAHLDAIVAAFRQFADAPRFARIATRAEIAENDDNLNLSRYVDTTVEDERIDVATALARLRALERERDAAVAEMNRLLTELGYATE
jgi:type I restriction enzyme M protein